MNGILQSLKSSRRGGAGAFYLCVSCTQPLQFFLIHVETWSIFGRRKDMQLEASGPLRTTACAGRVRQRNLETFYFI